MKRNMKKVKIKAKVIKDLLEKAKTLPIGTSITAWQLFTATYPDEEPDSFYMIRLAIELEEHAKDAGLYFDSSHHWGLVEGLPCHLDFIIKQRKKTVHFDQINYIESAYPGPDENLMINLHEKSICCFEKPSPAEPLKYKCTKSQWEGIEDIIKSCNFDQWEPEYNNADICDGMHWEIKLMRNGKTCRKTCGSSDYPSAWRIFRALKQMCIRLIKREMLFICKPDLCPFCNSSKVKQYLYRPLTYLDNAEKYIVVLDTNDSEKNRPYWGCEECGAHFFKGDHYSDHCW